MGAHNPHTSSTLSKVVIRIHGCPQPSYILYSIRIHGCPQPSYILYSVQGGHKNTWVPTTLIHPLLYTRRLHYITLGEKEDALITNHFPSLSIYQPGMLNRLVGDRSAENCNVWLLLFQY